MRNSWTNSVMLAVMKHPPVLRLKAEEIKLAIQTLDTIKLSVEIMKVMQSRHPLSMDEST